MKPESFCTPSRGSKGNVPDRQGKSECLHARAQRFAWKMGLIAEIGSGSSRRPNLLPMRECSVSYMAQITIYLPDDLENSARKAAKAQKKSVSRWVADQVVQTLGDTWPKGVLDAAGALRDFPGLEDIRNRYGKDMPRESIE
jgi:hypothetical protein